MMCVLDMIGTLLEKLAKVSDISGTIKHTLGRQCRKEILNLLNHSSVESHIEQSNAAGALYSARTERQNMFSFHL